MSRRKLFGDKDSKIEVSALPTPPKSKRTTPLKGEQIDSDPPDIVFFDDAYPRWFLFLWGAMRAYCSQKIRFGCTTPEFYDGRDLNYPEADILERIAKLIETDKEAGYDPLKSIPESLRCIAKRIRAEKLDGDNPREKVWVEKDHLFVRPIKGVGSLPPKITKPRRKRGRGK